MKKQEEVRVVEEKRIPYPRMWEVITHSGNKDETERWFTLGYHLEDVLKPFIEKQLYLVSWKRLTNEEIYKLWKESNMKGVM